MSTKRQQVEGQLSMFDEVYPLDIMDICDDPYCPKCGYPFWPFGPHSEKDCDRCPECGIRVDWTPWHLRNDEEETEDERKTES